MYHGIRDLSSIYRGSFFYITGLLFVMLSLPFIYSNLHERSTNAMALSTNDFDKRVIYIEEGHLLRGSIGDLIHSRQGNEIATCSSNGVLAVTYGSDNSWKTETVFTAYHGTGSSERARINSLITGDVYPEIPGDEILTVDDDGSLRISYHDGSNWKTELLFRDVNWLYEVDHGDIDGDGQSEIVVVGEEQHLVLLEREGGKWTNSKLASVPFYIEACRIVELEHDHPGKEVLFAGGKGVLWMAFHDGARYAFKELVDLESPVTDITTIDMDPLNPGPDIFVSTRDGKIYKVWKGDSDRWIKEIIHNEEEIIYGLESGYLNPNKPVLLYASYKHRMGLIEHDVIYRSHIVHSEEWNVLGCVIGDLDPIHPDSELFSLSQLGRLTMVYKDLPGLRIEIPFNFTSAHPGEEIMIPLNVLALGGLKDAYSLSIISNITTSIDPEIGSGSIVASLSLTAPFSEGSYRIELIADTGTVTEKIFLDVSVNSFSRMIRFEDIILYGTVIKDRQTTFTITSYSETGLLEPFVLSAHRVPTGMMINFDRYVCEPCDAPDSIQLTISVDTGLLVDRYVIFINGITEEDTVRSVALVIDIMAIGIRNYRIETEGTAENIPIDGSADIEVRIISENGFDDEVELVVEGIPPGINVELSDNLIVPTSNVTATISGDIVGGPYIAIIAARSGDIEHLAYIRISFFIPDPGIRLIGPQNPPKFKGSGDGTQKADFIITIIPGNQPPYSIDIRNDPLPEGLNITYEPVNLRNLPYSLNLTVIVWGESDGQPLNFNITVLDTVNVRETTLDVTIYPKDIKTVEKDKHYIIFVVIIILFVMIFIALTILLVKLRDHLKSNEIPSSTDGVKDSRHGRKNDKDKKLHHGIYGRDHRRNDR